MDVQACRGVTVLAVDDDPFVLATMRLSLESLGCVVLSAANGPAAIEILDSVRPIDVLFTDVVMSGGLSGSELVDEARRRRPELKTVMISGYSRADLVRFGWIDGKAPLLSKPFGRATFERTIRELVGPLEAQRAIA